MDKYTNNNSLIIAKVVSMAILSLCSFLLGILPLALTKKVSSLNTPPNTCKSLVISLLLCFGGGVLLFTTFLHLQPEVREGFERLESLGKITPMDNKLPLSEIVLCGGFFFVYLIEELVHIFLIKKQHSTGNLKLQNIQNTLANATDKNSNSFNQSNNELVSHEGGSHMHLNFDAMTNSFSGLLAVLALSFHAVFEGLAVGLEGSPEKVWYLFAAIATHKFVIAFCMGVELVTSKTKMALVFILMATFALVTPLGIGIGILLSSTGDTEEGADVTSVVLQGMAAGTLLYVVFFEVLAREKNSGHGNGLWKLMAITAGFSIMLALQVATGHEHSHSDSHDEDDHSQIETTATAALGAITSAVTSHPAEPYTHTY